MMTLCDDSLKCASFGLRPTKALKVLITDESVAVNDSAAHFLDFTSLRTAEKLTFPRGEIIFPPRNERVLEAVFPVLSLCGEFYGG